MKYVKQIVYNLIFSLRKRLLIPICRKNGFLADLYYTFFSRAFTREHQKVLNGIYSYTRKLQRHEPNYYLLRRQIHRLEKGLIIKNRRNIFALGYIVQTVNNFKSIVVNSPDPKYEGLLTWAFDVLIKYFEVVDRENEIIKSALLKFEALKSEIRIEQNEKKFIPYKRKDSVYSSIKYKDFEDLSLQRRSIRNFQNKPVPKELIEKAIKIASLSPSACNRQPYEFRIYNKPELKNKLGAIPSGITAYYENIPVIVVIIGKLEAYVSERDRHLIYLDGGMAAMSFMYALETLGLSSVPINWPDIEVLEKKLEQTIEISKTERPILFIGLGYADAESFIAYSQKKSIIELVKYNL